MEKPIVVLDACVLIPMPLCDTLLRAADQDMYKFYTSPKILEETTRNLAKLLKKTQNLDSSIADQKAKKRVEQIQKAFPEALVYPSESLISTLDNDPKDRHVLAAAIEAQKILTDDGFHHLVIIVTHNLKDFPNDILSKYHVIAISPDEFLLKLIKIYDSPLLFNLLQKQAEVHKHKVIDLLGRLEKGNVSKFVIVILNNYYSDEIIEIIKRIENIINRFGWTNNENNKFLVGKFYKLVATNQAVIVNHHTEGIIIESTCNSISISNLSCQHLKNLGSFVNQAYEITCSNAN
ncbi:PIN domain-containing protein [Aphanothece sacrum]|uniref:PIN domain-containing protein n=1 Tax=Aphanothece sacrum FPU1 TaxID=1920663 RepID=A0A401II92_APHSA|nr:PIN domain-containing protein [Aphanothece sacrum]GBF81017.1 hypothetical protein AsFPU1_2426 [Aphanothece sacrum FPU1]GBF86164.1 toxin-antitoxin system, toxin component, PIN family [Aphanothece sacrum FPU3]